MPLPPSQPRKECHTRTITCTGFHREDGLWDIDAHITDTKTYAFDNAYRGTIQPGEPLHGMWIRITVNDELVVKDCIAVTDFSPYQCCPDITHLFKELIGEKIAAGWTRRVKRLVGGIKGCTHLTDLMGPATTTIFQTMAGISKGRGTKEKTKPFYVDGCHTWASDGPQVKAHHPEFYVDASQIEKRRPE